MLTTSSFDRRQAKAIPLSAARADSRVHTGLLLGAVGPAIAILMVAAAMLVVLP